MTQPRPDRSAPNCGNVGPENRHPISIRFRGKRLLVSLAVVLAAVGAIIWGTSGSRQRSFNGKPESYWINSLAKPFNPRRNVHEYLEDLKEWRTLGPQAVPILVKALEMQPGPATKPYAKLWPKLPGSLQKSLPRPMDYGQLHVSAWNKLALASQQTNVSIPPTLVARALKDQNWLVRYGVLACLDRSILPSSGVEKDQFLPLLLSSAQDAQMEVKMCAVSCLGHYRNQPNLVIPVLTAALADPYPDVRIRAAMALHRVDLATAEKARLKEVAYDCLTRAPSLRGFWHDGHGSAALATQLLKDLEQPLINERAASTNAVPPIFDSSFGPAH